MNKNNKKEQRSLKKPLALAICSSLLALMLGVGAFVYFFVDTGGKKIVVEVPNLVGQNIRVIERQTFEDFVIVKEPIYSDSYERDIVVAQSPEANLNKIVRQDKTGKIQITVKVSLGKQELKMPNVYGYDCYEAACKVRELGVTVRFIYVYDSGRRSDEVIKSSPEPDAVINHGDKITLFVSRDRVELPVTVKNFCGRNYADAVRELMSDGLALGKISYLPTDKEYDGKVIFQGLAEGSVVRRGPKIDITVAKHNEVSGFYSGGENLETDKEKKIENGE